MQNNIDQLVAENESLRREMACLEKCLQERQETNEFEMLEKETQKEHEVTERTLTPSHDMCNIYVSVIWIVKLPRCRRDMCISLL